MNKLERTRPNALAPSDYATFELAKQNDGIIGSVDINQIRTYGSIIRSKAESIKAVIANMDDTDDINATKSEMLETAATCSRVSLFCDIRIGEITSKLPKSKGGRPKNSMDAPIEFTKGQALKEAGIDPHTASDFEKLAAHVDIVEAVLAEAEEKGETVSRNKVLNTIKEQEPPMVKMCPKCGVELTDENTYASHKTICRECYNKRNAEHRYLTFDNEPPEWDIEALIADLTANAPVWRETAMSTFDTFAGFGVHAAQKSIDAVRNAFDQLDSAIAAIVEG